MVRRISVRLLVFAGLATACTGQTSSAPTPSPPAKVDFVPLWPEHSSADLVRSQGLAKAGDGGVAWRTDPAEVASRFATQVLRWDSILISGSPRTWTPMGFAREHARVTVCPGECGPDGRDGETVDLMRMGYPGALWAVTSVQSGVLSTVKGPPDMAVNTPIVTVGETIQAFTCCGEQSLPGGTPVEAGSIAWSCEPGTEAAQHHIWYRNIETQVWAGSGSACTSSPGVVYFLSSSDADVAAGAGIFDSSVPLPPVQSLTATAVTIKREPGPLPSPLSHWIWKDPLSLRECNNARLALRRPQIIGSLPPRPYGLGVRWDAYPIKGPACRARFTVHLTLEDEHGVPLPIPGNPASEHVNLAIPGYPGAEEFLPPSFNTISGSWGLWGWCSREPAIVKIRAVGDVRLLKVDSLNSCSDHKNLWVPKKSARPTLSAPWGTDYLRDRGNV